MLRHSLRLFTHLRRGSVLPALVLGLIVFVTPAFAQGSGAASPAATAAPGKAQLEQLVAPIALYPDALLSQVLMASTYPLEVVEAARWSKDNPGVTGKALEDAMAAQKWDASVKALTAVPQTLQMMSDKLDWTQQLGDAFLAQQHALLDAVQTLRQRAEAAGHLKSTPEQKVTRAAPPTGAAPAPSQAAPAIVIEPVDPEQFYVPVYDPGVIYGAWPYSDYQPFYWYPPGFVASNVLSFAAGVAAGAAIWGNVDWWRRDVNINVNRYNQFNRTNIANNVWRHDPGHRHGVPYANRQVADKFGDHGKAAARDAYRGRAQAGQRDLAKQARQQGQGARKAASGAGAKLAGKDGQRLKSAQAARGKDIKRTKAASNKVSNKVARSKQIDRRRVTGHRPDMARTRAARGSFARQGLPHPGGAHFGGGHFGGGHFGGGHFGGGHIGGGFRRR